ncbi:hypothetical protein HYW54_00905 [Candidatus Gottesmanbacteria bacterium]|nr:hypothetical protein [Candidatus Gottesmanbacteria bacterium]
MANQAETLYNGLSQQARDKLASDVGLIPPLPDWHDLGRKEKGILFQYLTQGTGRPKSHRSNVTPEDKIRRRLIPRIHPKATTVKGWNYKRIR